MAYDFGAAFRNMLGDTPVDLRTPETKSVERQRLGMGRGMEDEYARASSNPNYGIGTPAQQQYMEQELANSVRDRTGAQSAGGSGFEGDQVRKALVDFRISQIAQRQKSLNDLRQGMMQATNGWQQPMGQPVAGVGRSMAGGFAGQAGKAISKSLFGESDDDQAKRLASMEAAGRGAQPGGNGYRLPGTQGGGPGNTAPGNPGSPFGVNYPDNV